MEKFRAGHFDLVITDRAMPEMNGDELADSIKRLSPGEPIIMLTGFADLINETGQRAESVDSGSKQAGAPQVIFGKRSSK